MGFASRFEKVFKSILPAPFTIAVLLTFLSFAIALIFTEPVTGGSHFIEILTYWEKGIWDSALLVFAVQMMLILVLGHILALSPPASRLINRITSLADSPAKAAWLVTFSTLLVAFFNWGLGLVFGAIIARSMGEKFALNKTKLNYPLIGAAGYSGLMIWHGGISGSAPAKVAENGHLAALMQGSDFQNSLLPASISFDQTVFSTMNLVTTGVLLVLLPLLMAFLSKRTALSVPSITPHGKKKQQEISISGAEKLDHSRLLCLLFALLILVYIIYKPLAQDSFSLGFITLNYINLMLLGLGLLLHGSFYKFLQALDNAISGASGILIQFPIYFGIMGIMKYSGLVGDLSDFFISISNTTTFPLFTFISAGIVNIFVPSGGGQWSIQGPILIKAASELGVSLPKSIMAMAYGDQLTNMLQPFWALPLLGITGLKAREIIPYSMVLLLAGAIVFIFSLLFF